MEDNPPRVSRKEHWRSSTSDHNKTAEAGPPTRKSGRYTVDEDLVECSGKYCRSCTAGLIADCVALCCCPCAVVNILALAFVKIPYKVGKRCLGLGKKKEKLKRKCKKVEGGGFVVERDENLRKGRANEGSLEIVSSGLIDEEDQEMGGSLSARFEVEKVWLELYHGGQLGFGRVSFTGIPSQGKYWERRRKCCFRGSENGQESCIGSSTAKLSVIDINMYFPERP